MKETEIPFVEFYSTHGIIPTRQDITDLKRHVERRDSLYRQLGLPDSAFRGASILEFGPGSGHNALVTGSKNPSHYLLVDGNPASIKSTRLHLKNYCPDLRFQIKESSILDFKSKERFDIVLAEGLLPTQKSPADFLIHLSHFVKFGGVIVFTTMDAVSVLPEMLRRWIGWRMTKNCKSLQDKVKVLVNFFSDDFKALPGMSRPAEDWVLDQIIHPWSGPLCSIPEAIRTLKRGWALQGSSPHFLTDWRWYKDIYSNNIHDNSFVINGYYRNLHNLLDYRYVRDPLPVKTNLLVEKAAKNIYNLTFQQERKAVDGSYSSMKKEVKNIAKLISISAPETSLALTDFLRGLNTKNVSGSDLGSFRKLWGRGQQYLCFVRCK
jgi:2-polyprenyl-3-methyl-5-hydroxy-6-metoxy-1,4-benzoquinol methylase